MVRIRDKQFVDADGTIDFAQWNQHVLKEIEPSAHPLIEAACAFAKTHGADKLADSGETCLLQGLKMAELLADLKLDADTIAAAIIFNSVQAAEITAETINEKLSPSVCKLLQGAKQMQVISQISTDLHVGQSVQMDNLRKMLLAMVEDVRVVLIKLVEQLCILRKGASIDEKLRIHIAQQAHNIYAPLANRLGIGQIKWEMEDLSFRFLEPERYKHIAKLLDQRRLDRETFIKNLVKQLEASLADAKIKGEVKGRVKHIYSIWRKMQRKNLDYEEIYDVRAVRILVDEIRDCYSVLGIVHQLWPHIPKEFDDYIAMPKENGYCSLHTAVIGPEGRTVEVQIRTHKMDQESELGVASHWRYKEGVEHDAGYEKKIAWLRQLLEWQAELADAGEVIDSLRSEVVDDRVYVLTPAGKVIDIQMGATPLDFAYNVHTEVGHRCRGAKVNGRIVPLTYQLQTGEQVEILTTASGTPSRDWLNPHLGYIKTSRARSKIHVWFKQQDWDKNLAEGKSIIERESQRLALETIDFDAIANKLNFKKGDDVLAAIGRGDVRPTQVFNIVGIKLKSEEKEFKLPMSRYKAPKAPKGDDITIQGVGNLLTSMARCCSPVPGDSIIGYITLGRGVTIHRKDCQNVLDRKDLDEERLIQASWGERSEKTYAVDVFIRAYDRQGLLRDITALLSNEKVNVFGMETTCHKQENDVDIALTLDMASLTDLSRLLDKLNQIPNVIIAKRKN